MLAALWQSQFIRLVPVGMVLLAIQRSLFVELTVAGVIIQIVLVMAAACGAAGGSERGAISGFILGVMYDLAEGLPIGSTAIPMVLAGACAGLLALIVADPQWWLTMVFTALGAAIGEADAILEGDLKDISYANIRGTRIDTLYPEELANTVTLSWTLLDAKAPTKVLGRGTASGKSQLFVSANLQTARNNALPEALERAGEALVSTLANGY